MAVVDTEDPQRWLKGMPVVTSVGFPPCTLKARCASCFFSNENSLVSADNNQRMQAASAAPSDGTGCHPLLSLAAVFPKWSSVAAVGPLVKVVRVLRVATIVVRVVRIVRVVRVASVM